MRQLQRQRVVVVRHLQPGAEALLPGRGERHGERPVHLAAPQGVQHDARAGVGGLRVAHALDQQPAAVGEGGPGGGALTLEVARQVRGRRRRQRAALGERRRQRLGRVLAEPAVGEGEQLAHALGEVKGAVVVLAAPEGGHRRVAGRRRHQHVVVGDLRDAPGLRAEHEAVADAALPDELLVELAEPGERPLQPQVEVAAVGDGAARGVEPARRARPRLDAAAEAVDGDARHQLAHPRVGVAAGEHLQHEVELLPRQLVVGVAGAQLVVEVVGIALLGRHHGQHHLGEHVERRADGRERLDVLGQRRRRRPRPSAAGRGRRAGRSGRATPRPRRGRRGRRAAPCSPPRTGSAPAAPRRGRRCRCRARASWWRRGRAAAPP